MWLLIYPLNLGKYNFLSKTSVTPLLGLWNKVRHPTSSELLLLTLHWTSPSQNTSVYAYQKYLKFQWQIAPMWMVRKLILAVPIPESPPTPSAIWVPASYHDTLLSLPIFFSFLLQPLKFLCIYIQNCLVILFCCSAFADPCLQCLTFLLFY